MSKTFRGILIIASISFALLIIFLYRQVVDISRPFPPLSTDTLQAAQTVPSGPVYYFGVISRFPPTLIYQGYQPIMDYLNAVTPYHFELRLGKSYQQTVQQLVSGQVAAAFLGSFLFAKESKRHHLRCILKPLNADGQPVLRAVVITKFSSDIHSLKDLLGKKVALPSRLSFSANWFLYQALPRQHLTLSDLDSVHIFAHHYTVVYEVLKGRFDAGVVKDRVAQSFLNRGIRIVAESQPVPSSPIVVSEKSPKEVVQAVTRALLAVDPQKPRYRKIVARWDPEFAWGFVPAKAKDYLVLLPLVKTAEGH